MRSGASPCVAHSLSLCLSVSLSVSFPMLSAFRSIDIYVCPCKGRRILTHTLTVTHTHTHTLTPPARTDGAGDAAFFSTALSFFVFFAFSFVSFLSLLFLSTCVSLTPKTEEHRS